MREWVVAGGIVEGPHGLLLTAWLGERFTGPRSYRYRLEGSDRATLSVVRQ